MARASGLLGWGFRFGVGRGHEPDGGRGDLEAAKLVLEVDEAFAEGTVLAREPQLPLVAFC